MGLKGVDHDGFTGADGVFTAIHRNPCFAKGGDQYFIIFMEMRNADGAWVAGVVIAVSRYQHFAGILRLMMNYLFF